MYVGGNIPFVRCLVDDGYYERMKFCLYTEMREISDFSNEF